MTFSEKDQFLELSTFLPRHFLGFPQRLIASPSFHPSHRRPIGFTLETYGDYGDLVDLWDPSLGQLPFSLHGTGPPWVPWVPCCSARRWPSWRLRPVPRPATADSPGTGLATRPVTSFGDDQHPIYQLIINIHWGL